MSITGRAPRRDALKAGVVLLGGCLFARPGRSQTRYNEYDQPKLDRTLVKYQNASGPDGHSCNVCTNFIAPSSCRLVDGTIPPSGYCLSFAPKDIDFK
jgi:hypothetical protein